MTKAQVRLAVQENLDDVAGEKWSSDRLDRILPRARRWVFSQANISDPGRRWIEARVITTTAGVSEYDLDEDEYGVESLERIAVNGNPISDPRQYERIEYADRRQYRDAQDAGTGRGYFYVYESSQASSSQPPRRVIGIIPTPAYTAGDFKVYALRRPDFSWETPGSPTEDAHESGLTKEWEDVLILRATVMALLQRPPREGKTLEQWKSDLREAVSVASLSDRKPDRKRTVRVVEDWPT